MEQEDNSTAWKTEDVTDEEIVAVLQKMGRDTGL